MKCEVDYCIYNDKFFCKLKETQLNQLGMCEECIIVSIPKNILKELKEKQLEYIETRWIKNLENKSDLFKQAYHGRKFF